MLVKVNGKFIEIEENSDIENLLEKLDIPKVRVAVELNGEAVSNSELLSKILSDQDVLEIVRAIGGG
tara:strand:- start:825 stop:1025 length:201 start_codon:yes stop_codon:yes gene_type:complete